jgi:hypothetical protein
VAVVTVSGYDLVTLLQRHLHADDDGLLADIEMAEAADGAHAIELARLFLETADQQHVAQRLEFLLPGEGRRRALFLTRFLGDGFLEYGHEQFRVREFGEPSVAQLKTAEKAT